MKSFIPSRVAEVIFALIFVTFGVNHFLKADMMSGMPAFMPGGGKMWVYIAGTAMILAAIAILTGVMKTLACYLLALMLLIFVFTLHIKPAMEGNLTNLLKDTAIAMCAILIGNRKGK